MTALAVQQSSGRPRSRFFLIAHRIARRFQPQVAEAFLSAVTRLQGQIDEANLRQAVAGGDLAAIEAAAELGLIGPLLMDWRMDQALLGAAAATGQAGADVLSDVTGLAARFNATHPNVIQFARDHSAKMVVQVGADAREAIRLVVSTGAELGLTPVQQARAIREVVGLPPNWANAPLNLGQELREGRFTATRRLAATDKAQIRSRLARGTVTEEFIAEMEGKYARSLLNRRALNIARTESLRSAHHGQRESWKQARDDAVIPETARRVFIVTPDDRLREEHAAVPGMNPDGVGLDEPFQTPFGLEDGPPLETNCRCGEGLIFPGRPGVI